MSNQQNRIPCEEELAAYRFFAKADVKIKAGKFKPAIGLFRQAVRMLEDVAGRYTDVLVRYDLAETISSIGWMLLLREENIKASREFYLAAVKIMNGIGLEDLPTEARMAIGMWTVQLAYLNEGAEAEKSARSAIRILEKLLDGPGSSIALTHMANGIIALARSLLQQLRIDEATAEINRIPTLVEALPEDARAGILAARLDFLEVIRYMPVG